MKAKIKTRIKTKQKMVAQGVPVRQMRCLQSSQPIRLFGLVPMSAI